MRKKRRKVRFARLSVHLLIYYDHRREARKEVEILKQSFRAPKPPRRPSIAQQDFDERAEDDWEEPERPVATRPRRKSVGDAFRQAQ